MIGSAGENGNDEKFHELLDENGHLVRVCMTTNQLISQLDDTENKISFPQHEKRYLDYNLSRQEASENSLFHRQGVKEPKIDIYIRFRLAPVNLIEQGTIVYIELIRGGGLRREFPSWWESERTPTQFK